jgi:hypothetical protein
MTTEIKRFKFTVSGYVFALDGMDAQGFVENAIWDGYDHTQTQIIIDDTDIKELSVEEDKRLTEQERQEEADMEYEMLREDEGEEAAIV